MRRVLTFDVEATARALLLLPQERWESCCFRWIQSADVAHRFKKKTGKDHLIWGGGSLADVVPATRARAINYNDPNHCSAVVCVLAGLVNFKATGNAGWRGDHKKVPENKN